MALVRCKECGQQMSSSASKCPHCGKTVTQPLNVIGGIILGVLLLGALATFVGC